MTETFFTDLDFDAHGKSPFAINGYRLLNHNRKIRTGGGVALYVKDCLTSRVLYRSEHNEDLIVVGAFDNSPEYMIVEITSPSSKLIVAVLYRRPSDGHMPSLILLYNNNHTTKL